MPTNKRAHTQHLYVAIYGDGTHPKGLTLATIGIFAVAPIYFPFRYFSNNNRKCVMKIEIKKLVFISLCICTRKIALHVAHKQTTKRIKTGKSLAIKYQFQISNAINTKEFARRDIKKEAKLVECALVCMPILPSY